MSFHKWYYNADRDVVQSRLVALKAVYKGLDGLITHNLIIITYISYENVSMI